MKTYHNFLAIKTVLIKNQREIMAMKVMRDSKHVIGLYDCFSHGLSIWLSMPFCKYSLSDIIPVLKNRDSIIKKLVKMLVHGVAELHAKSLAHKVIEKKVISEILNDSIFITF